MRWRIDDSTVTHLAVCSCGWRGTPAGSHMAALLDAKRHELRAHPGDSDTTPALDQARRRQRRAAKP